MIIIYLSNFDYYWLNYNYDYDYGFSINLVILIYFKSYFNVILVYDYFFNLVKD